MKRVKDELASLDLRPSKKMGQNFLVNESVLNEIVEFADPKNNENLVEIGPGLGALTSRLIALGPVTAIEIEPKFCRELSTKFPDIKIINDDVRLVDFSGIGKDLAVFGNLPYSFSTDIIFHLLIFPDAIRRAILLLQREFAERMAAKPGGKEYGVLSISVQMVADLRLGPIISGGNFHPRTAVDSRVVELVFNPDKFSLSRDEVYSMKKIVRAGFMKRRKKLHNSLRMAGIGSEELVDAALQASGIDGNRRAETLTIPEFIALTRAFMECSMGL